MEARVLARVPFSNPIAADKSCYSFFISFSRDTGPNLGEHILFFQDCKVDTTVSHVLSSEVLTSTKSGAKRDYQAFDMITELSYDGRSVLWLH